MKSLLFRTPSAAFADLLILFLKSCHSKIKQHSKSFKKHADPRPVTSAGQGSMVFLSSSRFGACRSATGRCHKKKAGPALIRPQNFFIQAPLFLLGTPSGTSLPAQNFSYRLLPASRFPGRNPSILNRCLDNSWLIRIHL